MKKFSTYLAGALLSLVVFTSCSSDPAEVDVTKLDEPCDFVNAMEDIAEAGFEIMESVKGDESKLTDDDKERGEALQKKMGELLKAAGEKKINITDCEDYKAYQEKMEELEEKMRELR